MFLINHKKDAVTIYTQKLLFDVAIFLGSLGLCALLAFMETSITAIRLFKIKELERTSQKYKAFLQTLESNPQYVLMSVLIATNMMCIISAILLQNIIENIFADFDLPQGLGFTVGIALGTIIVSLVGEIIPKSIAQSKTNPLASLLWLANIIFYIVSPITGPLLAISRYFSHSQEDEHRQIISEQEIRFLINYIEKKGLMEADKTSMLQNIFRMENTHVKEILIPNSSIISVDINNDLNVVLSLFKTYQYSRFPVFQGNPENIIGIVYQKDLFLQLQLNKSACNLRDILKPIIFVPDSLKVSELLKDFKRQRIHMAMVVDEYGSTIGLVTLEDALEEIVGDIADEHEPAAQTLKIKNIIPDQEWSVDATIDLDRLEDVLQINFQVETAVTLGGFLTEHSQRLLKIGENFFYKGFCFTISQANEKRVLLVHIKRSETKDTCSETTCNKNC
ncbi:MAG TPA: hemolysin family protein [Candidatus Saccharimonadales bacterium]|nr:hemolysin family protein [Candidatus Saccharimonadales bacterium]